MSEPAAFCCEPPASLTDSPMVAALRALPLAKQAEIHWRLADAIDRGDERELRLLRHVLRSLREGLPQSDPSERVSLSADEFRAEFDA